MPSTTPNTLEPNMSDAIGARTTRVTNQVGRFDNVYDTLSYTASLAGPVATASALTYRPQSADIVNAAVNSTASAGGPGSFAGGAGNYNLTTGGRGVGALTGSVGVAGGVSALNGGGSGDMISQSQQMLAESQASSIAMLMVQDEMGQQNRLYTSTSNMLSARDTLHSSIIRNIRGS